MRATRTLTTLGTSVAFVLFGSAAGAVKNYTFTGKLTSNRGKLVNIPVVGNTSCGSLTIMSGPGKVTISKTMTPAVHPIVRGANTQPKVEVKATGTMGTPPFNWKTNMALGRDLQCVKHAANRIFQTTGKGKGGAFVLPTKIWSKPLPPYVAAVAIKYAPPVIQLATSFKITGPRAAPIYAPAGTMATGCVGTMASTIMCANTAARHAFKTGAWQTQTGRVAPKFTWCPPNPPPGTGGPCTNLTQAGQPMILKYPGTSTTGFGGTMAYIITTGPNVSSLGLGVGGLAVAFLNLQAAGSQPTGRGYADYLPGNLMSGPIWGTHAQMTVTPGPIVGQQRLITKVGFLQTMMLPPGTNFNWGFPFTTMTVLVRNTGTAAANPRVTTITAMGADAATAMARNLSLVAGGLALARLPTGDTPTPEISSMLLTLPEPGPILQRLAGVIALLGVAIWRSRRCRG